MKYRLCVCLALAAIVACWTAQVEARGGGGGGRGGGGFRGGAGGARNFGGERGSFEQRSAPEERSAAEQRNIEPEQRNFNGQLGQQGERRIENKPNAAAKQNFSGQAQQRASQAQNKAGSRAQPFTPSWYAQHPQAWRYAHPHADAWAAATFGAATAWLGVANGGYADDTTNTGDTDDTDSDNDADTDDDSDEASQDSESSDASTANDGEYLPLGVYALARTGATDASVLLQLAVRKDGTLAGSYYDLVSDQDQNIQGSIDKKTQLATWTVGPKGRVVFGATLATLTQAAGPVSVHFDDGQNQNWTLARYEGPKQSSND